MAYVYPQRIWNRDEELDVKFIFHETYIKTTYNLTLESPSIFKYSILNFKIISNHNILYTHNTIINEREFPFSRIWYLKITFPLRSPVRRGPQHRTLKETNTSTNPRSIGYPSGFNYTLYALGANSVFWRAEIDCGIRLIEFWDWDRCLGLLINWFLKVNFNGARIVLFDLKVKWYVLLKFYYCI